MIRDGHLKPVLEKLNQNHGYGLVPVSKFNNRFEPEPNHGCLGKGFRFQLNSSVKKWKIHYSSLVENDEAIDTTYLRRNNWEIAFRITVGLYTVQIDFDLKTFFYD